MATHHGKDGVVKVGSDAVLEVNQFSINETGETADDTSMGDDWRTHLAGHKSWTASITVHWDPADSTGQEALTVGASASVKLYPSGDQSGDAEASGDCTITSVGVASQLEGVVSRTIEVQGNGALTWGTVV